MLQNVAILDDFTTISTLVKQNLTVTVPMLQTNIYGPSYDRKDCDFGWKRTMNPVHLWATPGHLAVDPRIKVSCQKFLNASKSYGLIIFGIFQDFLSFIGNVLNFKEFRSIFGISLSSWEFGQFLGFCSIFRI